jgi:hypothetical protein
VTRNKIQRLCFIDEMAARVTETSIEINVPTGYSRSIAARVCLHVWTIADLVHSIVGFVLLKLLFIFHRSTKASTVAVVCCHPWSLLGGSMHDGVVTRAVGLFANVSVLSTCLLLLLRGVIYQSSRNGCTRGSSTFSHQTFL